MPEGIQDKVVIITGASSGLGQACARLLASQGAKVVMGARREDRIRDVAAELNAGGAQAVAVRTDVAQRADVERLADAALDAFGRIDVLINNAGVMPLSRLDALQVDEWEQMIDVNLRGVLYGIGAVLPHMKAQRSGHIINVASTAGHRVGPTTAVYSATKYAVRALSEGLRQEMAEYNVRSTIISPGAIATELLDGITDKAIADQIRHAIVDSMPAEAVAEAVAYAINQPQNIGINEILLRPTAQER